VLVGGWIGSRELPSLKKNAFLTQENELAKCFPVPMGSFMVKKAHRS